MKSWRNSPHPQMHKFWLQAPTFSLLVWVTHGKRHLEGDFMVWLSCMCKTFWRKKKKQGRGVGGIDKRSKKRYWKFTLATICGLVRAASFRKPLPDSKRVVPPYLNALRFLSSLGRPKFPWHSQLPRPPFHVAMPQASSSARGLVGEPRTWGYGHRGMWRWVGSELVSQTW